MLQLDSVPMCRAIVWLWSVKTLAFRTFLIPDMNWQCTWFALSSTFMRKMHTGKLSAINRNLYKTSIETNGLLCSMVDIVSCSFHDISLLCHLHFGLPNLLVAFFFTWQSGDRSKEAG